MVDDMKKLVEKYKRELMEYNRSSSSEKPSPLHFPEMIADSPEEGGADNKSVKKETHETAESPAMKPKPEPVTPAVETETNVPKQGAITQAPQQNAPDNAWRFPSSPSTALKNSESFQDNQLSENPVSGQSPDEQLGGSDFENTPETRNSRSDIKPLETQTNGAHEMQPEREYADLQDFYNINNRRGTLRFRVYTAREALPVAGAIIEVTKVIGNNKHTFYKLTTDISGNTPIVYLPAPSSELSQYPENTTQPYALYDVYITADNFRDVSIKNLPIFDGILSEQSIAMVPMAAGGTPRQITENGPRVNGGVY